MSDSSSTSAQSGTSTTSASQDACRRIFEQWHERARAGDVEGLLALYDSEAVFESPLVPALFDHATRGALRGHAELRPFLEEGTRRRPNNLVKWSRTGKFFCRGDASGRATLMWEYPRETPDGEQIEIVEVMELKDGLIAWHRIYWGWFGCQRLIDSAVRKASGAR